MWIIDLGILAAVIRLLFKHDHLEKLMATAREELEAINESVNGLVTDVERLIGALENSGQLDAETQALADSVKARLGDVNTRMDTAVPEAPAPNPEA